jgi:hypothetical protein
LIEPYIYIYEKPIDEKSVAQNQSGEKEILVQHRNRPQESEWILGAMKKTS